MKYIYLIILLFSGVSAETVYRGRVINASRDSAGVANIKVHLQVFRQRSQAPSEINTIKSRKDGSYRFFVPERDSTKYVAAVDYEGVRYYSRMMAGDDPQFPQPHQIVVYDSTHTAQNVTVKMHHVFVEAANDFALFRETRIVNNPMPYAITGAVKAPGAGEAALRFTLPSGAVEFSPLSAMFGNELVEKNGIVYDLGIALPGNRRVSYSWALPWKKNDLFLSFNIDYPTGNLDFFVADPNIQILSNDLQDYGDFVIRGSTFQRYGSKDLRTGDTLEIRMTGISQTGDSPFLTILFSTLLLTMGLVIYFVRPAPKKEVKQE